MKRKITNNALLTSLNYMAWPWARPGNPNFHDGLFLGFLPLAKGFSCGKDIGGQSCMAVHVFRTVTPPGQPFFWGDDPRDTAELASAKPWVLMFKGNDNHSCFSRFETQKDALAAFDVLEVVDPSQHMFYNS